MDQDWCPQLLLRVCRWLEAKLYKLLSPCVSENKLRYLCPSTKITPSEYLTGLFCAFQIKSSELISWLDDVSGAFCLDRFPTSD